MSRGKEQDPLVIILPNGIETANPFSTPFSEFVGMSKKQKIELNKQATEIAGGQLLDIFDNEPNLPWILVYGSNGNIIKPRSNRELPTPDALLRFGRRTGITPFLFTRPHRFEDYHMARSPHSKAT